MSTFEEILARDGVLVYRTRGVSMRPMLRQNRDLVEIRVPGERLKPYDVALYRRGRDYVLHRVIEVREDGYIIRGDNTYGPEEVPDSAVIGVLTGFVRKGKKHSVDEAGYRCYARFWHAIYPLRARVYFGLRRLKRLARRMGITPVLKRLLRRK